MLFSKRSKVKFECYAYTSPCLSFAFNYICIFGELLFYVSAVTCKSMTFTHVLNSTDNSVGAVVHVSCPNGQIFNADTSNDSMITTCSSVGSWNPYVPECKGINIAFSLDCSR